MTVDPDSVSDCVRRHAKLTFARSGGKGGQNVNKVATKAVARVRIRELDVLDGEQQDLVRRVLANRINDRDEIVVWADDERVQSRNREIALDRLTDQVVRAARRPRARIRTRKPARAHEARLEGKKLRAGRKRDRRRPDTDD